MPRTKQSRISPLGELIAISRAVGDDPDLVQGGGGNTSVKSRDGKTMFVKASGTALAEMERSRGWAEVDLGASVRSWRIRGSRSCPPSSESPRSSACCRRP